MFKNILKKRINDEFLKSKKVSINNSEFLLPRFEYEIYPNLTVNDIWMIDILKRICPSVDGSFIDVGVNVGQTLLKLKSVKNLSYFGFEPNINCVYYLNKLVEINKFNNVHIIPTGISNKCGITKLTLNKGNLDSGATMVKGFRETEAENLWVSTMNIDKVKNGLQLNNVSILKIDVEGLELEVMESFKIIIQEHRPYIFIEVLPCYEEKSERYRRQKKLEDLIKSIDYKIFRINKSNNEFISLKPVNEFGVHSNLNWSDYLLSFSDTNIQNV